MSSITDYNDAAPADDGTKTNANKVTYASITTNLTDPLKNFVESNLPIRNVAGAAPTVTDDSADGFEIGSAWVDTSAGIVYMCTDETAGAASWANISDPFPSGTKMLFQQTAAPTGWTKDTTHNDKALRIVSGTVGTGGSVAFSTVFGITATDAHTLTVDQIPAHTHTYNQPAGLIEVGTGSNKTLNGSSTNTGSTGGGTGHSHNIDLQVNYVDIIIATKD